MRGQQHRGRAFPDQSEYVIQTHIHDPFFNYVCLNAPEIFSPVTVCVCKIIRIDRECTKWSNHCFLDVQRNSDMVGRRTPMVVRQANKFG
jgi:hypothetical protein